MFRTHLTVLDSSASLYSSSPVFKVPRLNLSNGIVQQWHSITYKQFYDAVRVFARHWMRVLKAQGIAQKSVVGLWLGGMTYTDVLHIYGVSRAGFVPQLFSLRLPSPEVVFELLQKSNAKALIFDPSFESVLSYSPVPVHLAVDIAIVDVTDEALPEMPAVTNGDDSAFVFHTSGSTSDSPKLIPCSYIWLNTIIDKANQTSSPKLSGRRDVTVWMGSMCHIGQTFMLLGSLQHGSCTIQPTKIGFSSGELMDMAYRCGLNRLNQFATFLVAHLRRARDDTKLLGLLRNFDEVLYSGLPLPREDEEWAYRNGIKLRNVFGSTECGAMMLSVGGRDSSAQLLRPLKGVSYGFFPISTENQTESGHQSTAKMLELVVLADSGDCPDRSLRQADGHFHTGDLFQEVTPGSFAFCGRDDDWIKSENSLRCDTKSIEDHVRATCGHLLEECIVVGNGRPSPTLFIEPASDVNHDKIKKEIIGRTRQFNSRRYLHERISSPDMIIIVPQKTLPRTATKGNIRRRAVEEMYEAQLNLIYCGA